MSTRRGTPLPSSLTDGAVVFSTTSSASSSPSSPSSPAAGSQPAATAAKPVVGGSDDLGRLLTELRVQDLRSLHCGLHGRGPDQVVVVEESDQVLQVVAERAHKRTAAGKRELLWRGAGK